MFGLNLLGEGNKSLGGVLTAIEHHILDNLEFGRGNVAIQHLCCGIDNTKVHTLGYGMIEEDGMHGLAYPVVATEREGQIAHTATDMRSGEISAYPLGGTDKVGCIGIMLLHTSGNSKHIGVEDYIQGIHPNHLGKKTICTLGDFYTSLIGGGLSFLVEAHHDNGGTIAHHVASMAQEHLLAFLEGYGVDDAFALHTFQSGGDDIPFGGINHNRYARDVGFACHEVEERGHLLAGVEQSVVHIYVDHLCPVLHLLAGDGEGLLIILFLYQSQELARTSHIAAFTNIDKSHLGGDIEQLKTAKPHCG